MSAHLDASQTAWALLGLMAAGEIDHPAVARGIEYLSRTQGADGFWNEPRFTATGFPRMFYLRYHGYSKFFPLWAMARYRNLKRGNTRGSGVRDVGRSHAARFVPATEPEQATLIFEIRARRNSPSEAIHFWAPAFCARSGSLRRGACHRDGHCGPDPLAPRIDEGAGAAAEETLSFFLPQRGARLKHGGGARSDASRAAA